jgi:hypothetical protein
MMVLIPVPRWFWRLVLIGGPIICAGLILADWLTQGAINRQEPQIAGFVAVILGCLWIVWMVRRAR